MKFIHRLGFYSGGFIIGLVILFFFLSGKKTSCDYGPEARVLKNIRIKNRLYSPKALQKLSKNNIDTANISEILRSGNVDFSKSKTDLDSCKQYVVKGKVSDKKILVIIENCNDNATILDADIEN